jgi:hypothetical protein
MRDPLAASVYAAAQTIHRDAGVVDQGAQRSAVGLDERRQVGNLLRSGDVEDDGPNVLGLEGEGADVQASLTLLDAGRLAAYRKVVSW